METFLSRSRRNCCALSACCCTCRWVRCCCSGATPVHLPTHPLRSVEVGVVLLRAAAPVIPLRYAAASPYCCTQLPRTYCPCAATPAARAPLHPLPVRLSPLLYLHAPARRLLPFAAVPPLHPLPVRCARLPPHPPLRLSSHLCYPSLHPLVIPCVAPTRSPGAELLQRLCGKDCARISIRSQYTGGTVCWPRARGASGGPSADEPPHPPTALT
ncbi:hypothetical protein C8F04DRAFT_1137332 [Mycena alexandri]|uniref:Uncharacterized protein n=1 Tax=Mycena alexandri TaxID=1745969 RepID=A0AAD6S7M8_9AGAR|nr:hypothetical protein C8F04DRAFT_1137332 [Mycena alexandri]